MHVGLNRLEIFYTVYGCCSVSKAARQLNLSQPAVSQQIKKLEQEIGIPLFTRLHKRLVPTSAAIRLYKEIAPFLSTLDEKIRLLKRPSDKPFGLLRLGSPYEFGREYLPMICHNYRQQYPDVEFKVELDETIPLLNRLDQGSIDIGIIDLVLATGHLGSSTDYYSITPLIDEELVLVCSAAYYERHKQSAAEYKTLAGLDFISDDQESMYLRHWFSHHYDRPNTDFRVVMLVESHQACLHCVRLGMGLALTCYHLVWQDVLNGNMVVINTARENGINTIALSQLQDKKPTLTEKSFCSFLLQEMKKDAIRIRFAGSNRPESDPAC